MSFNPYPKYKDSGVEWLDKVPEAWRVHKFRYLFQESPEKIDSEAVGPMLSVSGYRGIEIKDYDDENRRRTGEDLIGYRIVRPGQLVVNPMWLNFAGLGVSDFEGHVSPAYRAYSFRQPLQRRFVHHLLRCGLYVQAYTRVLAGIRPNSLQISRDDLMDFPVLLPPAAEQTAIAAFLDRETSKIDALISEQQRLIELLSEKRQAGISHAVTKGLNPKVPMKPSGIEWLGDVPAHWSIGALKYYGKFATGSTPDRSVAAYWNGHIPWVKTGEINYKTITSTEESITEAGLGSCAVSLAAPGTLLMALYGQGVTRGRVALLGIHATFNQACVAVTPDARLTGSYLRIFFMFAYPFIREGGNETTQMNLSAEYVRGLRIPIPPRTEQNKIAGFLESVMTQYDSLISASQRAIDLLQERRTGLISAAVTGQIDVRTLGVSASLSKDSISSESPTAPHTPGDRPGFQTKRQDKALRGHATAPAVNIAFGKG